MPGADIRTDVISVLNLIQKDCGNVNDMLISHMLWNTFPDLLNFSDLGLHYGQVNIFQVSLL